MPQKTIPDYNVFRRFTPTRGKEIRFFPAGKNRFLLISDLKSARFKKSADSEVQDAAQ